MPIDATPKGEAASTIRRKSVFIEISSAYLNEVLTTLMNIHDGGGRLD
jgi:hypothetical protein